MRPPGDQPRAYRSVIINESFARRYFKDQDPIGARLGLGARPDTKTNIEIIGVVKDFSRRTLRDEQVETMFLQYWISNPVTEPSTSGFAAARKLPRRRFEPPSPKSIPPCRWR